MNYQEYKELDAKFPTEAQIKEWKDKHKLAQLTVFVHEKFIMVLRTPKIPDWERAQVAGRADKSKPYNFQRSIINNCKLYVSEGMMEDDDIMMEVYAKIDELETKKEISVGKL